MDKVELQRRMMKLAMEVIKLTKLLPKSPEANVITYQIVKSSSSTGANYRAACRARSAKDFISKLGIAEEECDETIYWLEFMVEAELLSNETINPVLKEANEILAILVSSILTAKRNSGLNTP